MEILTGVTWHIKIPQAHARVELKILNTVIWVVFPKKWTSMTMGMLVLGMNEDPLKMAPWK